MANGGTLFLDELGELNKNIQVKLLRFLESGEIRRVGDTEPFRTDVRVLCATNRDLRQMIQEDDVPRGSVLPHQHFRDASAAAARTPAGHSRTWPGTCWPAPRDGRSSRSPDLLTPEAIDVLLEHEWPGNVRELANVMEHAYIIAGGGRIMPEHLPHTLRSHEAAGDAADEQLASGV